MSDRAAEVIAEYLDSQFESALSQFPLPCPHGLQPGHCIYCDPLDAFPFGSSEGVAR